MSSGDPADNETARAAAARRICAEREEMRGSAVASSMKILLTGATGYIGSAVLTRLTAAGHDVMALVRSSEKADELSSHEATALIGDASDAALVERAANTVDVVVHIASSPEVDEILVPAALAGLAERRGRLVLTGGIWIYGSGEDLHEESPFQPLPISGWRAAQQRAALESDDVRAVVVAPGIVYGRGAGIVGGMLDTSSDSERVLGVGSGEQHWAMVHIDDLADLYLLAAEHPDAAGVYIGAGGHNPTVAEIAAAIAQLRGADGVADESEEAARARLGSEFADALLLDQSASGSHARRQLGWEPAAPTVLEEIVTGSYAESAVA